METKNVSYFPFEWNVSLFPNSVKKVQEYIKGTVRHVLKENISKIISAGNCVLTIFETLDKFLFSERYIKAKFGVRVFSVQGNLNCFQVRFFI